MHHDLSILRELAILAGAALAINLLFRRLRLPSVVAFLFTGILIGPGGFALVRDPATVNVLAEIGIVLLLFAVGLEFSLADLRQLGRGAAVAGTLQIAGTAAGVAVVLLAFGAPPAQAIFFGMLLAPSSTALVFRLLTDRGELTAPHGKALTGVLLLQDLAVVPMVLLVPALAAWSSGGPQIAAAPLALVRGLAVAAAVVVSVVVLRRVVPWLLARASRGRSRETFLAAVLFIVLGSAWLSEQAGLSIALGAFLAGLFLAESEMRSQVIADVMPFRDTFLSVFFISIGMLVVPAQIIRHPGFVIAATVGMVVWKLIAASLAARIGGYPWRTALVAGLGLAHVGEFSFLLSRAGAPLGLLPEPWDQSFLAGAVFSMMVTPWLISAAPDWALQLEMKIREIHGQPLLPVDPTEGLPHSDILRDHVVIAGFGLNGRNLARVLRAVHVRHIVVDLAPEGIVQCSADGSPGVVGDVTQPEIQRRLGISRARVLVLAISDPVASRHAVRIARQLNLHLFILVRTRAVDKIDALHEVGANLVIPEEFETSIEIFTSVLREYHVPPNVIDAQVQLLRQERYSLLRGLRLPQPVLAQLEAILTQGTTEAVVLLHHSPAIGMALWETGLLEEENCKLVAVVRGGNAITEIDPQIELRIGDTLVITGTHAGLDLATDRLRPPAPGVEADPRLAATGRAGGGVAGRAAPDEAED